MKMRFSSLRAGVIGVVIIVSVMMGLHVLLLPVAYGQGGGRPTPTQPSTPPKKTTTAPKRTTQPKRSSPPAAQPARPTARQPAPQIEMVLIPAGTFTMGSPAGEGSDDEKPQHRVNVQSFYMGKYEVTQAQWQQVMGSNPSNFKGDNLPAETVSWNEAQEFIRKLNAMNDGYVYRLPTEGEWEYACRARTMTAFAYGDSLSPEQANFNGNSPYGGAAKGVYRQKTTPVGTFQPNAFGLYDMHGNVWEWCEDWYHDSYNGAPTDGSAWLSGGEQKHRVLRGGSWLVKAGLLRSADRGGLGPGYRYISLIGLRVVAVART